jgi:hypothetical protein
VQKRQIDRVETLNALALADHSEACLAESWRQLGLAGGWWTAFERVAIAREKRAAMQCALCVRRKAALSPYSVDEQKHESTTDLPDSIVDVIHRITTDPGRLSQRWYDGVLQAGIRAEELVEIASILGVVTLSDTFSRALSLNERELPKALGGEPHRQSVSGTKVDRAWVPMVEFEYAESMLKMMYDQVEAEAGFVFNVIRALTSVPEAVRDFFGAFIPNYQTHLPVDSGGLDRSQVELLASATSAWNDCFY